MNDASNSKPSVQAGRLLESVQTPMDLRRLALAQLPQLCAEMRAFLMETVPITGGHLGSNLGVVELTVALHTVFDLRGVRSASCADRPGD